MCIHVRESTWQHMIDAGAASDEQCNDTCGSHCARTRSGLKQRPYTHTISMTNRITQSPCIYILLLHCTGVEPVQRVKLKVVRARASRASGHAAGHQQLVCGGRDTHMLVARAYNSCVVIFLGYGKYSGIDCSRAND